MLIMAAGVFLFLGINGVLWMSREAAHRERVRLTFSRLSAAVPNLRHFPGWGRTDSEALTLAGCSVESVQFSGDTAGPEVSLHITNKTSTAAQPAAEVTLYDVDGNRLDSCKPVEFLFRDFQPGEEKEMPESFSRLRTEPVFYSVSEPSIPDAAPAERTLGNAELKSSQMRLVACGWLPGTVNAISVGEGMYVYYFEGDCTLDASILIQKYPPPQGASEVIYKFLRQGGRAGQDLPICKIFYYLGSGNIKVYRGSDVVSP